MCKLDTVTYTTMSTSTPQPFLGCSPTLDTNISPNGIARQNFKYYLILGGVHAAIYRDQSLASELARTSHQREPKGYNDEEAVGAMWRFNCSRVHKHPPHKLRSYVSPFPTATSVPPCAPPTHVGQGQELNVAFQDMAISAAKSPTRELRVTHQSVPVDTTLADFGDDFIQQLSHEASPYPHVISPRVNPAASSSKTSRGPLPSVRSSKSKASVKPPSSPSPQASSSRRAPSPILHVGTAEPGSGLASESEDDEKENQVLRFHLVKFVGGCNFYSTMGEAMEAYLRFRSKGLQPQMRTTTCQQLAMEFAAKEL
ncbi:hypothetical protein VKT23_010569 [Stygiomarasmius scandens]|uniref:Uncharacterized protein n=1 Tax=Marasmiellus scandens TaxID=2682957 RepID=A0ABR1JER0_9AGAR